MIFSQVFWACDTGTEKDTETPDDKSFACVQDKDGWEQCEQNMVEWCHGDIESPHFHWGSNCEDLGLTCTELSKREAACVDESSQCAVGEFKCEDSTAYNCINHDGQGRWTVAPCLSSETCKESAEEALCEASADEFDPQTACDIESGADVAEKEVTTVFDDVFSEDYHAELNEKVQVTLPDNAVSYIHFPVYFCGAFGVFVDDEDVFDGILHRDGTDMTPAGGQANEICPKALPEHWVADLEWDGEGTEGDSPAPYVVRFKAVPSQTVNLIIVQQSVEEEGE